ncbi:MAG TPA: hypothetical protein VG734_21125 [Lacunisphaera sp.]|nr:hypothetical protein [Lacunisphaera sp.]
MSGQPIRPLRDAVAYQIKEEPAFIRISFSGTLKARELQSALKELEAMEAASVTLPPRLIDLSDVVKSEINAEDVQAVASRRKSRRFPNSFRSAIVAPEPAQYGYARMFQSLTDHPDIRIQVFESVDKATAWLTAKG